MLLFAVFLLWAFGVQCENAPRIVVDGVSCRNAGFYDAVYQAALNATLAAQQAQLELEARNRHPNGPIDLRIQFKTIYLYGDTKHSTAQKAYNSMKLVASMKMHEVDNWSPQWQDHDVTNDDIIILCNMDHIQELSRDVWYDKARKNYPSEARMNGIREGLANPRMTGLTLALADDDSDPNSAHSPCTIILNPLYLLEQKSKGFPALTTEKCEKASSPDFAEQMRDLNAILTPVDGLFGLEQLVFHELTHSPAGGDSIDADRANSYQWRNCVRLAGQNNAENLAFFAMTVKMIKNCGFDVKEDGTVFRIQPGFF
ncbi:hypothetical protein F4780DRAFT_778659 [Xylariomycetidae sp. FL0641]|nr:hypothetical protein F4780DRAFT_778659 [Xylariomycetidae sp. FL0641]